MSENVTVAQLRATYRDMSDEELAELEADRADLTAEARATLDSEVAWRGIDLQPRVAEIRRERYLSRLQRWNDDDFLQYVRTQPVLDAMQRSVIREEILRRDLDAGTFLGATEREGQEPAIIRPAGWVPEPQPFQYGVVLPPGEDA
jgi:hypothetical protein